MADLGKVEKQIENCVPRDTQLVSSDDVLWPAHVERLGWHGTNIYQAEGLRRNLALWSTTDRIRQIVASSLYLAIE